VLYLFGSSILKEITTLLQAFLSPDIFQTIEASRTISYHAASGNIIASLTKAVPLILGPFMTIILMIALQRSAIFVGSNIAPKLERISPISGFKKKFGSNGIFEFLKSFVKLCLYASALAALLYPLVGHISNLSRLDVRYGLLFTFEKATILLLAATAIALTLAIVDYAWQVAQFNKKNMMTFQEIKDEHREAEGDPHFKSMRRQRALEIASNRMMQDVPNADVVIVNPTHYAVALEWNPAESNAPIVLAKGVDEIALKIREVAETCGIPIHVDIPTARHLSSVAAVGDEVPVEFYQAVAAAIRFAQAAQQR
jgi:flagellar biosynthetic protein FlhB